MWWEWFEGHLGILSGGMDKTGVEHNARVRSNGWKEHILTQIELKKKKMVQNEKKKWQKWDINDVFVWI